MSERRYPGDPQIIGRSTVHMDTERIEYIPIVRAEGLEAERDKLKAQVEKWFSAAADAGEVSADTERFKRLDVPKERG